LVVLECDRCKNEGEQYELVFPDGQTKEFILCERHSGPLRKLREVDYGTWKRKGRGFKKTPIEDLEK
jgi:hypothetical protein